jgi:hypothetical protein
MSAPVTTAAADRRTAPPGPKPMIEATQSTASTVMLWIWPLAILSFGESWHNSHHADPTGARHGVLRGQVDPGARLIWIFEKLGWARDVRWPDPVRLDAKRHDGSTGVLR